MADSSPFANAGLGMFGTEKSFIQSAMRPEAGGNVLGLLASLFYTPDNPYKLESTELPPAQTFGPRLAPPRSVAPNPTHKLGIAPQFSLKMQPAQPGTVAPAPAADTDTLIKSFWGTP